MPRVAVVGSINTDLIVRVPRFAAPGETISVESLERSSGGKGANQATAARRLGAEVRLVGSVGTDGDSQARLDALGADGVDLTAVTRVAGEGGVALIEVDQISGQNRILLVGGANQTVNPAQVTAALANWLEPDDILCCQLEVPLAAVAAALRAGRSAGATSVLNAVPVVPHLAALLDLTDVLVVNEIEAGQLLAEGPGSLESAPELAQRLQSLGPRSVVITFGAQGAYLRSPEGESHVPAPVVSVVDTTGAGDALVGGIAAGLAEGSDLAGAVRLGVLTGSFSVQRPGAQPSYPTRPELDSWAVTLG